MAHQRRVRDHRRRGGGAVSRWHDRLLGVAERTQGQVEKDRDGRVRPALSQRIRSEEAPLFERKALLKKIIAETDIQFSESFEVEGREMFKHACKTGLEGVVSKVRDTPTLGSCMLSALVVAAAPKVAVGSCASI
jgi:bifunctional non-homologous end joining protein LigD